MATKTPSQIAQEYESLKSQYAGYSAESDSSKRIKSVSDSLKVPRSPVQPHPIVNERDKILKPLNLAVIQAILLALVEFLVIPPPYASYIVFITLCVGAAAGIYLSNR